MFRKLKDRLSEVSDEVKRDPRFQSVNQLLAGQPSFNQSKENNNSRDSAQPQSAFESASGSTDHYFSLVEDDDIVLSGNLNGSPMHAASSEQPAVLSLSSSTVQAPSSASRMRRTSSGSTSMISDAATLFPIYESPQQVYALPSDLESTAGSEWDDAGSSSAQLSAVSKEQLFQMLQKMRVRYHKYKGRYTDVAKAYTELSAENQKVKNVMQQTQDKALRRISDLNEQCQLEQKAKRHLEEELRSDIEEKEHIIKALQTKVVLLKSKPGSSLNGDGAVSPSEISEDNSNLIDLESQTADGAVADHVGETGGVKDSEKMALQEKVKRLESLLTKCKESIQANKQKTQALSEVKESLSKQLSERDAECSELKKQVSQFEQNKKKAQEEELQIAETKMVMHQEIITKDEEIAGLRATMKKSGEDLANSQKEVSDLRLEIDQLKSAQETVEKALEVEKAAALKELSRGKASAVQTLHAEAEERMAEMRHLHEQQLEDLERKIRAEMEEKLAAIHREKERELLLRDEEIKKQLNDKLEEARLAREELELRVASLSSAEGSKNSLLQEIETKLVAAHEAKKQLEEGAKASSHKITELEERCRELNRVAEETAASSADVEQVRSELAAERESASSRLAELRQQIESASSEAAEVKSKCLQLEEEKTEWAEKTLKLEETIGRVNEELKAKEMELVATTNKLASARDELDACSSAMQGEFAERLKQKEDALKKDLEQKNEELKVKEQELAAANSKLASARDELDSCTNNMQGDFDERLKQREDALKRDLEQKNEELSRLQVTYDGLLAERSDVEVSLEEERKRLAEAEERIRDLETRLETSLSESRTHEQNAVEMLQKEEERRLEAAALDSQVQMLQRQLEMASEGSRQKEDREAHLQSQIETLTSEKKAAEEELASLSSSSRDLERELAGLRERDRSAEELKQQMISYEKELQDRVGRQEETEAELRRDVDRLTASFNAKCEEVDAMALAHQDEIARLKADLEMKMRFERERENSHQELKEQSIEYQKKLQEKLEECEEAVRAANAKLQSQAAAHKKELESSAARIEHFSLALTQLETEKQSVRDELEQRIVSLAAERDHEKTELKAILESAQADLSDLKKKLDDSQAQVAKLSATDELLSAKEAELSELTARNSDLEAKWTAVASSADQESVRLTAEFEAATKAKEAALAEVEQLRIQLGSDRVERDALADQLAKAQSETNRLMQEVAAQRAAATQLEDELVTEQKRVMLEASRERELSDEVEKMRSDLANVRKEQAVERETASALCSELREEAEALQELLAEAQSATTESETGKKSLEARCKDLQDQVASLQKTLEQQTEVEDPSEGIRQTYEIQLAKLRETHESELESGLREAREKISLLNHELFEKNALYDDLVDSKAHSLAQKEKELEDEVEACSRMHQARLSELEAHWQQKVKELEQRLHESHNAWGWDSVSADEAEDLQHQHHVHQHQHPATLSVTNHVDMNGGGGQSSSGVGHPLEEATEFEYLRNILFQYMLGRESLTLAKVLATVVKFTPDQIGKIISHEEKKQSILANLGFHS